MSTSKDSPALQFLQLAWDSIPRRSWRNRNAAMHSSLHTAISCGMEFEPGDIKEIYSRFNAGWIGENHSGLYSLACESQSGSNIPAAIAWEQWYGRQPYLWAEWTRTAKRLHVGSRFTWQEHLVTLTSFSEDGLFLTACTYKEDRHRETEIGDVEYFDGNYREILNLARSDRGIFLHLSPKKADRNGRDGKYDIARRFKVPLAEISAARKDYDSRRRAIEKELRACEDMTALDATWQRVAAPAVSGNGFRHFDVEMIREARDKAAKSIKDRRENELDAARRAEWRAEDEERQRRLSATHDADLARWMAGEEVGRHFSRSCLRVKGEWVETSTGQRATVAGSKKALTFISKHREKGFAANGVKFTLDAFPLESVTSQGVQIGCTFIEWSEIDRIAPLLK